MTTLRERIGGERRRLKSVRQKLTAAVAQGASSNTDWAPFYVAVSDYMETSIGRLLDQDIKMGEMIQEKVETVDETVKKALANLEENLTSLRQRLDGLLAARDNLRGDAAGTLQEFEAAGRALTDYIATNLGHQAGGSNDLAAKLFGPEDWEYMAGVTDEAMAKEIGQFEQVNATTPSDLQLPNED
ncbi:MAG: hypothetical protein DRR15_17310 [Gammaproteobacteria bacterium]|nr:MAG: hypothetical protein DRR15_17310 [Gammaproteobacteria bacterium]